MSNLINTRNSGSNTGNYASDVKSRNTNINTKSKAYVIDEEKDDVRSSQIRLSQVNIALGQTQINGNSNQFTNPHKYDSLINLYKERNNDLKSIKTDAERNIDVNFKNSPESGNNQQSVTSRYLKIKPIDPNELNAFCQSLACPLTCERVTNPDYTTNAQMGLHKEIISKCEEDLISGFITHTKIIQIDSDPFNWTECWGKGLSQINNVDKGK